MRLSAWEEEIGYDAYLAPRATVTLDGVVIKDCVVADEERGYVVVLVRGDDGRFAVETYGTTPPEILDCSAEADTDAEVFRKTVSWSMPCADARTEKKTGKVCITFPEDVTRRMESGSSLEDRK